MLTVEQATRLKNLILKFGTCNYREGEYLYAPHRPNLHIFYKQESEKAYDEVFRFLASLTKEEL